MLRLGRGLPKDKFFKRMERLGLALTFDDVRLRTGYSEVMPADVNLESKFSRNIPLKIPIVSAAMDTVAEYRLAIELAKHGGLGIIHRGLSPEVQAYHVGRVKHHLNGKTGLIEKPICVYEDETINEILRRKKEKDYQFDSFPVLNRKEKIVGILTGNDFAFCENPSMKANDVMTSKKKLKTASQGTSFEQAYKTMQELKKKHLPLIDNNGKLLGLYSFKDIKDINLGVSEQYNLDSNGHLIVGAAIGVGEEELLRLEKLVEEKVDVIVMDTAHADTKSVIEALKKIIPMLEKIKRKYLHLDIVVGNISEAESTERLIKAGADGVRVGQGPGAICTTRPIAGTGTPQVTAVYNCSRVGDKYGVPINADGGLTYSGDITLAIGTGAKSVTLGSMLAGTDEAPGEKVFKDGRLWKEYRGMGSLEAMQESQAARDRYRQSQKGEEFVPEGVTSLVPYKGTLNSVLIQYVGGLRSGMGYVGAANIEELRTKARFYRISAAGQRESHPHDVLITEEAPNYPGGGAR